MSAGAFTKSRYIANNGDIHPIRVQPETLALQFGATPNDPPPPPVDTNLHARVGGGNRGYGLKARSVTIAFKVDAPAGYKVGSYIRVPILQAGLWNAINIDDTCQYLGETATVIGVNPERRR